MIRFKMTTNMNKSVQQLKEVLADEIFGEAFLLITHDLMTRSPDALGTIFVTNKIKVSELKKLLAKEQPKRKKK